MSERGWWVDGHFIVAHTSTAALEEVRRLYAPYEPEIVRPWTDDDQAELDWINEEKNE